MRTPIAALTGLAVLLVAAPAFAFEQTPEAPPAQTNSAPQGPTSALNVAPATGGETKAPPSGVKLGFGIFRNLDFGLELLYGDQQQQTMQLEQQDPISEDKDVTVIGTFKRHF